MNDTARRRRPAHSRDGMTLLEVIVAVFLLSVVLGLTTYTLIKTNELWQRARYATRMERTASDTLLRLSTDLREELTGKLGAPGFDAQLASNTVASAETQTAKDVTLALPSDSLVLRLPGGATITHNLASVKERVPAEAQNDVAGVDIKVHTPQQGWQDVWQPGTVPDLLRVTLVFYDKYMYSYRLRYTEVGIAR